MQKSYLRTWVQTAGGMVRTARSARGHTGHEGGAERGYRTPSIALIA